MTAEQQLIERVRQATMFARKHDDYSSLAADTEGAFADAGIDIHKPYAPALVSGMQNAELLHGLDWALDLLDLYDKQLIAMGEPEGKVYSETHLIAKQKARNVLNAALAVKLTGHAKDCSCYSCGGNSDVIKPATPRKEWKS